MKIVRLKREELAEWRKNVPHLVDAEGHLVAEVDISLQRALDTVTRSARAQRKTLSQLVAIGTGPATRQHAITVTIARTGINDTDLSITPTIDGHRVVTGQAVFCAKMFQKHGECQLRLPNGVILKFVRDPAIHRPSFNESQQLAPKPDHCPCKAWGNPHPGTHYSTCPWNKLAPLEERAPSDAVTEEEIRILPSEAFAALKSQSAAPTAATAPIAARVDPHAVVAQAPALDAPENCRNGCLEWATPKGYPIPAGQHHPTCFFAKAWAIKTSREAVRYLVDLRNGQKVRVATDSEVGQAEIAARRSGSPIIHVDSVPYAVVLESELEPSEAKAEPPAASSSAA